MNNIENNEVIINQRCLEEIHNVWRIIEHESETSIQIQDKDDQELNQSRNS